MTGPSAFQPPFLSANFYSSPYRFLFTFFSLLPATPGQGPNPRRGSEPFSLSSPFQSLDRESPGYSKYPVLSRTPAKPKGGIRDESARRLYEAGTGYSTLGPRLPQDLPSNSKDSFEPTPLRSPHETSLRTLSYAREGVMTGRWLQGVITKSETDGVMTRVMTPVYSPPLEERILSPS